MREKPNPAKKKPSSVARRTSPASARANAKPKKSTFYVTEASPSILSNEKPKEGDAAAFATFEDARLAAIDRLLQTIEDAERQLTALKRARQFEHLA